MEHSDGIFWPMSDQKGRGSGSKFRRLIMSHKTGFHFVSILCKRMMVASFPTTAAALVLAGVALLTASAPVHGMTMMMTENPQECLTGPFDPDMDYFPDKVAPEDSEYWSVEYHKSYKIVTNLITDTSYLLVACGAPIPALTESRTTLFERNIPVPVSSFGVSQSTMFPFVELLGVRPKLDAYLSPWFLAASRCILQGEANGDIQIVSDPQNATEMMAQGLDPAIMLGFFGNAVPPPADEQALLAHIPISNEEEDTNEAVFEWIKYYSVFFNQEALANEIWADVKGRVVCVEANAATLTADLPMEDRPTMLWAYYSNYCGGWDVAIDDNYYSELAQICHANLLSTPNGGGTFVSQAWGCEDRTFMTTPEFATFAENATVWIYPAPDYDDFVGNAQVFSEDVKQIPAFRTNQVYDNLGSGRNAWFEQRLAEPDVVLEDFCDLAGTLNSQEGSFHRRHWFRNVVTEPVGQLSQCADYQAPLQTRGSDCLEIDASATTTVAATTAAASMATTTTGGTVAATTTTTSPETTTTTSGSAKSFVAMWTLASIAAFLVLSVY